jgi:Grx4 family monothiol glutaredoxin
MTKENGNLIGKISKELKEIRNLSVINFYAEWYEACKSMNDVFKELSVQFPSLVYYSLPVEENEDLALELEIDSVPTFVFIKDGKVLKKIEGADAPKLKESVEYYSKITVNDNQVRQENSRNLKSLVNSQKLMIFIKGTPQEPRCGFSSRLLQILKDLNLTFGSFDVLQDDSVRQGLKEFSNWPTYPQIYVKGEFIGGLDILEELVKSGEFQEMTKEESLQEYLEKLTKKSPVMLFMKGNPQEPKCGFSRQIVSLLNDHGIQFGSFDILEDDQVRQGLKEFSDWPTYPQLYVKGEFMGGLDIVKETIQEIKDIINQ